MPSPTPRTDLLKVNEIFYSIQGESSFAGKPCIFIRLAGCNLRCFYCDTTYAYSDGKTMSIDEIVNQVQKYTCPLVEITGGEPLLQDETPLLANMLLEKKYTVLVETNGTKNIDSLPSDVIRIVDIKTPASGEDGQTDWDNINRLKTTDEVKFVLMNKADYDWTKEKISQFEITKKAQVHLSPVNNKLAPAELAEWILKDRLDVRLQVQLHKILWPGNERGK